MSEKVKLARYRNTPYYVRYPSDNGRDSQFTWTGAKGNRFDVKPVPREVVDYLTMNSVCFDKGELVIIDDDESSKEAKETIADKESYEKNTHTKEEVEKLLKGNFKKLEKELKNITVDSEKEFIVNVAQDMKKDLTAGKLDLIADWVGTKSDILFD